MAAGGFIDRRTKMNNHTTIEHRRAVIEKSRQGRLMGRYAHTIGAVIVAGAQNDFATVYPHTNPNYKAEFCWLTLVNAIENHVTINLD